MVLKQVLEVVDLLDSPKADGHSVKAFLAARGAGEGEVTVTTVRGVSDADGAATALAAALKLLDMRRTPRRVTAWRTSESSPSPRP